jgi:phage terminase large subunit GpA-like protein
MRKATLSRALALWLSCYATPPKLSGSAWANQYRKLSPEASATPGDFDIDVTPFMRELLDAICGKSPEVMEVWIMKSSQVAYSENLNNAIGYRMHLNPGPIMLIQPTVEMAESYGKDRIQTMLRDSPVLSALTDWRARTSGNTILRKNFPGGFLQLTGANSPAGLAGRPIRDVCCDEVDRFPFAAGLGEKAEGDPIDLLRRRQTTFFNRMFVAGGTPVRKGMSRTEAGYNATDKRVYAVPCPRCSDHIELQWGQFEKDPESANYARYACQSCGEWIDENERFEMIKDEALGGSAHWVSTRPEAPAHRRGYFIWSAYSPFMGWREICDEWNEVKGDTEREQVFTNTILGLPFSTSSEDVDSEILYQGREAYTLDSVPDEALVLTAGVDTQNDRFEVEVVAWGLGEESWSVDYRQIMGDPAVRGTRQALDEYLLNFRARREDGVELPIRAAFVDSGGHRTDSVYTFVRGKVMRHVFACKGMNSSGQPVFARFSPLKKARVKLALVGTDSAKEVIYARLSNPGETVGRMHFPEHYDLTFFQQLTAEEQEVVWTNGQPRMVWKKKSSKGDRNEPLDCRVYALAALRSMSTPLRVWKARDTRRRKRMEVEAPKNVPKKAQKKPALDAKKAVPAKKKAAVRRRQPRRKRSWMGSR